MKKSLGLLFVVGFFCFLVGCAAKFQNSVTPDNFIQKKNVSIGLIWTCQANIFYPGAPEYTAKYFAIGPVSPLTYALIYYSSSISDELVKIKLKDLMNEHYFNVFKRAFENYNFIVKINADPYCPQKNQWGLNNTFCSNALESKTRIKSKEMVFDHVVYDYKPVIKDLNVDYLLVIDLIQSGLVRYYWSIFPTSPPQGYTVLVSYLIDGKTDEVISQHISSIVDPAKGEWDEPPTYSNLMNAVRTSFETAIDEVFIDIFKEAP